ncbi:CDF family Co(II)/Ni(II) efflux transporter DmeF [Pelagicoccus sp. SDUM812003]|uniref:CDF family Co(II)/Ni(II) efflux transporter DmeF n=1 Tax=Pelagicoccus sp. SDUM812003 TaxID=3041267 RepID=UPI00280C4193|nr:CDF family Co(II)/Ni(II) efflux transporter DmeF [Pelagicoccus sp. SDUM812003]MDQ8202572.1 CDF family Co(II)/Ni(II) efflux transporter DmeF [Pelagicoccus sp. SDUM812003]
MRSISDLQHSHTFGQEERQDGERRTLIVIAITFAMMIIEIGAGVYFGSMALLADGLHMASHAAALAINAFAYIYARRNAANPRFSFGTGKVNALGGYTGALLLAGFAVMMAWESVERLLNPVSIAFNWAIAVAIIGLVVNGASMLLLGEKGHHHHHHHGEEEHHHHEDDHHQHGHHHHHEGDHHHHDHNLRSAYLHVMADALTSVTAIVALLAAKYFGWIWMDPLMGIVGSLLVANWSLGLIRSTSQTLLDHQASDERLETLRAAVAGADASVTDLHLWSIGPGLNNAQITIASASPLAPEQYKQRIPKALNVVHATVEIHKIPAR